MRKDQKTSSRERSLLAVAKNKEAGILFWSKDWQSQQGQKANKISKQKKTLFYDSSWQAQQGRKSGLQNTKQQQLARKKVGKVLGSKWGQLNGLKNQSVNLKKTLSKEMIWFYEKSDVSFFLTVPPQKSFAMVINILQAKTPEKINKGSFYKILHGTRPQMYGWRLWFIKF
uniref:Putative HNH homing endonuclease n=1 Tax=Hazenia capsulata TaxID=2202518 RepID=A0A1W6EHT0_9CHLO|nr:putative HNH homing endonuclease [Hazenia capsulata]ARK14905.1 putative HNH homing endonuclease [Hazenia capsulata]